MYGHDRRWRGWDAQYFPHRTRYMAKGADANISAASLLSVRPKTKWVSDLET